jgi:hypothetical protein
MSRNLLPPLRAENNIGLAKPPGAWQPFHEAWNLAKHLHLPAEAARRGAGTQITSIPSPWARMLLFRHALEDGLNHPLFMQVVSDVLDTLELTFFQGHLRGQCFYRKVDLLQLDEEHPSADPVYLRALTTQVPLIPVQQPRLGQKDSTPLDAVTLIYYGDSSESAKLVALSSPFTLFVTPQDRPHDIEGYFEYAAKPDALFRGLGSRDPGFVTYLDEKLLPQLRQQDRAMGGLLTYLDQELTAFKGKKVPVSLEAVPYISGMGGTTLHKLGELRVTSPLSLRPTRTITDRAPLVLTDNPPAQIYYNRVPLPRPWILDPEGERGQLPGTHIRYPWIYPADDFLEPVLVEMPDVLRNNYRDRKAEADTARYLLPLKPSFFEFFRPEDVPGIVSISRNPYGVVTVQLDIPVQGTGGTAQVVVQKMYSPNENTVQLKGTYLSLWPNFQAKSWQDYYLLHFEHGRRAAESLTIEFMDGDGRVHPPAERQTSGKTTPGVDSVEREQNTLVYHTPWVPEVLRLVLAGEGGAGVILPKLEDRNTGLQEQTSWRVGIDFGTSNTIIAMRGTSGTDSPGVIKLGDATRLDLVGLPTPALEDRWETTLSYYFYPAMVEAGPFPSHIFWRTDTNTNRDIPGIHANIPFSGALSSDTKNVLLPNLKWSDDPHANHLTRLFLRQVVMMVEAEALARHVSPRNVRYAWSYPMAFSEHKVNLFRKMWEVVLGRQGRSESRDESTCSLLFFQSHSDDFTPDAVAAKVTIDIGGGTSDIAAYADGGPLFRDSILFGGQDLTGSARQENEKSILNPFVKQLLSYAEAHGFRQKDVIDRYSSSHSKFNYLIRTEWFSEHQGDIASQPWFERFQIATFYFFSVILFYVGLQLRGAELSGERLPNIVYVGGNGSRFLDWLTSLTEWSAGEQRVFSKAFSKMLQAGMATGETVTIEVRASGNPKHEVAVGLLQDGASFDLEAPPAAVLGEEIRFGANATRKADESTIGQAITPENYQQVAYIQPLAKREITRLNNAFLEQLASIGFGFSNVQSARKQLESMDEAAYSDALRGRIGAFFKREGDQVYNGSLLTIEASACLSRLL